MICAVCLLNNAWATIRAPNVLLILTETSDLPFTESLVKELKDEIDARYAQNNIYYEYLDVGKLKPSSKNSLRDIIIDKYDSTALNAVFYDSQLAYDLINTENQFRPNAGHFLMHSNSKLDSTRYQKAPYTLFINNNYGRLIVTAFALTGAEKVFLVVKSGEKLGFTDLRKVRDTIETLGLENSVEFIDFTTHADTSSRINSFTGKGAVVVTPFYTIYENSEIYPAETARHLASLIKFPVFVHWDTMINDQVVGGYVISSKLVAREIAVAMANFFSNKTPSIDDTNIYTEVYNADLLDEFTIDIRALRSNAVLINKASKPFELSVNIAAVITLIIGGVGAGIFILFSWLKIVKVQQAKLSWSEKQIQQLSESLQVATSTTELGMWEYDVDTQVLIWDEWMFRHHSKSPESFTPSIDNWLSLLDPSASGDFKTAIMRSATKGFPFSKNYQVNTQNNQDRYLSVNAQAIMNIQDQAIRLVGSVRNTTQDIIHEQRISQEQAKSKSVIQAKSQFIANTSQEIRTPMNVILGSTELLTNTPLTLFQTNYVDMINSSANSLMYMVNDIHDLARLETGKLQIYKYNFDLQEFMQQVIASFERDVNAKGLNIKLIEASNLPAYVFCDAQRIKQVLFNLIDNAIKYTQIGHIELSVHWQPNSFANDSDNGVLSFAVSDTGVGIREDKLPHVFEKFDAAHVQTFKHYSGSGFGLHITKDIAGLLNGEISVESKVNQGSRFVFSLPVAVSGFNTDIKRKTEPIQIPNLANKCVLIVDDVEANRIVISQMLLDSNIGTVFAENGLDALEKFKLQKFDFILMDVLMPLMDGFEATRAIRSGISDLNDNEIVIISLTAKAMHGDEQLCIEAGMDGYLSKPFACDELYEIIRRLVI